MNDIQIYFDNAAAARPDSDVINYFSTNLQHYFLNQEAGYKQAHQLREKLGNATTVMCKSLIGDVNARVFYGASGTDLFNLLGNAPKFNNGNIVVSVEHPALIAALRRLGAELRFVGLPNGKIDTAKLEQSTDNKTVLVAIHHVNNETGCIQNLIEAGKIIRNKSPRAIFLADTIQSAGKIPIPWHEAKLDVVTVSGHKIGAFASAALLVRNIPRNEQFITFLDNARKNEYRIGRCEPAALLTLSNVCENLSLNLSENFKKISILNTVTRQKLQNIRLKGGALIKFTAVDADASPYIIHFLIPGYDSAVLVRMLSNFGVCISAGSACRAESAEPSQVLLAMGFSRDDAYSGMRLSFWHHNTEQEVISFIETFQKTIDQY